MNKLYVAQSIFLKASVILMGVKTTLDGQSDGVGHARYELLITFAFFLNQLKSLYT